MGQFSPLAVAAVTGLIVFGTTTSLFGKITVGPDGEKQYFRKPWMMTLVMFIGMSFCLPMAKAREAAARRAQRNGLEQPLLPHDEHHKSEWRKIILLAAPTIFDLIATVLMNVGLLSVTASVYQMMRGAEMLFAALFAVLFLGRKLNSYHYGGIVACVVGISLVGVSSILAGEGSQTVKVSTADMIMGMGLIVASQITFEDFFMSDMNIMPMTIVGYEGMIGVILMLVVMMPIAYFLPGEEGQGLHENTLHTFWMLAHNPTILGLVCFMAFALLMYNISGMNVTGELGAVFRTVLETTRTLFVWLVLGLQVGESWSKWSWIQLAGFVVLVSGTVIYSKGDDRDVEKMAAEEIASQGTPPATGQVTRLPAGSVAVPGSSGAAPVHIVGSAAGKATMNINQFSTSLRHSYVGSLRASGLSFPGPVASEEA